MKNSAERGLPHDIARRGLMEGLGAAPELVSVQKFLAGIDAARIELETMRLALAKSGVRIERLEFVNVYRVREEGHGYRVDNEGTISVVEIAVIAALKDGREVSCYLEIRIRLSGWSLDSYIAVFDEGEDVVWQGARDGGSDFEAFERRVSSAAQSAANAMLSLDFDNLPPRDIGRR